MAIQGIEANQYVLTSVSSPNAVILMCATHGDLTVFADFALPSEMRQMSFHCLEIEKSKFMVGLECTPGLQ